MTHENFNKLVDSLEEIRINTLKTKNAKYAPENDALHNFHVGAEIMGTTVPQCIWGYATKHIVALRDKIARNDWADKDDALEKIQDIQNYLTFIWCAINEDKTIEVNGENTDFDDDIYDCNECKFDYIGDDDSHWNKEGHIIIEPCASCRNNICPSYPEYKTAKINFIKKE
jgi:hypothetical protein